ncbi:MAG: MarR family transcriptional regulator [Rhodospirillales bacterium]|jgi:DNA-binding MarR family transcriptional regulator|nr:MarR family transcriptional regulator [Rhodospirillales bacterium]MDP6643363.1 MarR family transcriptional regulator [Rhodospirillales bacterium]MDP6840611.1 MarR family transcriptional regulator [Rhodospirillales bacterium]
MNEIKKNNARQGSFDIRDRLAFRIATLASTISLWAGRTYHSKCGITMTEWRVLVMLATLGPLAARQICETAKMDKGNVSRAVKKLLDDGRISEQPDPDDLRASILRITPKGRVLYRKAKKYSDEREARLDKILGPEDRKLFEALSDRLQAEGERMLKDLENE